MTKRIGAAILTLSLMFGGSAPITAAAAAPSQASLQRPQAAKATDLSARRRARHHPHYAYRRTFQPYPYYYERPYYYAPAPFVPFDFGSGIWPFW